VLLTGAVKEENIMAQQNVLEKARNVQKFKLNRFNWVLNALPADFKFSACQQDSIPLTKSEILS